MINACLRVMPFIHNFIICNKFYNLKLSIKGITRRRIYHLLFICRNYMFTKRHYKPWSILFPQPLHITSFFGRPDHQLTATSAKASCGVWRDKDFVAPNAVLSAMKNARTCSMLIACNVSIILRKLDAWFWRNSLSTQLCSTLSKATYIIWV